MVAQGESLLLELPKKFSGIDLPLPGSADQRHGPCRLEQVAYLVGSGARANAKNGDAGHFPGDKGDVHPGPVGQPRGDPFSGANVLVDQGAGQLPGETVILRPRKVMTGREKGEGVWLLIRPMLDPVGQAPIRVHATFTPGPARGRRKMAGPITETYSIEMVHFPGSAVSRTGGVRPRGESQ